MSAPWHIFAHIEGENVGTVKSVILRQSIKASSMFIFALEWPK